MVHLGRSRLICKFETSLGVFERFQVCAAPHSLRNIDWSRVYRTISDAKDKPSPTQAKIGSVY